MNRVAVVGSGPAGFYTILRILKKRAVHVDLFEALPVPYGLTRFGVAPDHPEVRNCQERFAEVAGSPHFRFYGNTTVGKDVSVSQLLQNYHAVVFAYGAETSRGLNVPGSQLPGVISARDFVGWYNGEPAKQGLKFTLDRTEDVSIVGNGNVALDVARVLLRQPDDLRSTDMPEHAIAALTKSTVKKVHIVGRRGPVQSAFTTKELRELLVEPQVQLDPIVNLTEYIELAKPLGRAEKRKMELLLKGSTSPSAQRTWSLDFMQSPSEFKGEGDLLQSIEWTINTFAPGSKSDVVPTEKSVTTPTDLAVLSIGYKSVELPGMKEAGMTFIKDKGILENHRGHVTGVPGAFAAGWLKTGPTGVIASTMMDAFSVGDEVVSYLESVANTKLPGADDLDLPYAVSWNDWLEIDRQEIDRGKSYGKPREKFVSVPDMLNAL
ncbi:putative NADPH:adrenodoxin oxidoreductase, mitochondrial [Wickerhamiella sorbophila]|uniref:NADPH:adrenodoxin oxidoreductase, mitochondrial n=1 Tax=Wickerhamiella sorbophila TaxID=45607 RepID=A0A2T0FNG5_9ASCO|nr:putative NADPH:adrenodoxin oxidoreductase, mitochondrial [Wickerhamiella sorbophila]PRT56526.1 putative NADPH:adrenodoxin oxidoreductase, mitochondrial [Wickerhamiella sorbophila]